MQSLISSEDTLFEDNKNVFKTDEPLNDAQLNSCIDSKPIICHFCYKVISSEEFITHQFNVIYKCEICDASYSTKSQFQNHSFSHKAISHHKLLIPEKLFACYNCYEDFSSKKPPVSNLHTHAAEKPYVITAYHSMVSGEGLSSVTSLDIDLHSQADEKQHICKICNKSFFVTGDFKHQCTNYLDSCTKEKPFFCDICKKEFAKERCLKLHYIMHEDKKYVCEFCSKVFKREGSFKKHCQSHNKKKPVNFFSSCTNYSRDKIILKDDDFPLKAKEETSKRTKPLHSLKNSEVKICPICKKKYPRRCSLQDHICKITYTQRKCKLCGEGFRRIWELENHLVLHNNSNTEHDPPVKSPLKPSLWKKNIFVCRICNEDFCSKYTLLIHLRTHKQNKS